MADGGCAVAPAKTAQWPGVADALIQIGIRHLGGVYGLGALPCDATRLQMITNPFKPVGTPRKIDDEYADGLFHVRLLPCGSAHCQSRKAGNERALSPGGLTT